MEEVHNNEIERNVRRASEIFSEHGAFLLQVFKRELDEHDANDLWQSLYVSLVNHPPSDSVENVGGYLYRAARNDILDFKQKSSLRRKKTDEYSKDHAIMKVINDPVSTLIVKESIMKAFSLIKTQFSPSISQAVLYKRRDGLKNSEIAGKMCIKKQTVETYLSIGTTMIKEFKDEILGDNDGKS